MGHIEVQHGDKHYTMSVETFIIEEKPPLADVTITAIDDNDGCIWRLNPLMTFKGSSTEKFVTNGFYTNLLDPQLLEKLEHEIRSYLTRLKKLP